MATVSANFTARKEKILKDLSVPAEDYTDLSPKGSVDAAIIPLIRDINRLPGLVTTSSCAGRISVFLERGKAGKTQADIDTLETERTLGESENSYAADKVDGSEPPKADGVNRFVPKGGKGSGTWQFVSHSPLLADANSTERNLHGLFGLKPSQDQTAIRDNGELQLVKFKFEPMILHIMAASLKDAQPVLAAASNAGFRESGLQGLRCLEEQDACPIVAVRSSGLGLESIIGYVEDDGSPELSARSLVTEDYLQLLVQISNERFKTNSERTERFRVRLLDLTGARNLNNPKALWEDPNARRERKRAEGLERSKAARKARICDSVTAETNGEDYYLGSIA
ncbi:putative tRNA(Phe) 7-[(3-amino-3-carboxypropyl)-4-demethylwyosine(37)-N(4)] [Microsporum audouinii]